MLYQGNGGNILTINVSDFKPLQTVAQHGFDLLINPGAGFISESINVQVTQGKDLL